VTGEAGPGTIRAEDLEGLVGEERWVSRWFEVDQGRIDAFAVATEDWQFIHVDPVAAARTPFGGTIAHGFLTVSLLAGMSKDALPVIEGAVMGVNYGFDLLRFLAPVKSGARIRGCFALKSVLRKEGGRWLLTHGVRVEIDGEATPALAADWVSMRVVKDAGL
jgi:acyl dehydratase